MRRLNVVLALVGSLMASQPGAPQDGSLGFSYVATTGNTSSETLSVDLDLAKDMGSWELSLEAGATGTRKNGGSTNRRYEARGRARRRLGHDVGFTCGLEAEWDKPAGIESRYVFSTGVSTKLLNRQGFKIEVEVGAAWTKESQGEGLESSGWGGLLSASLERQLAEGSTFKSAARFYPEVGGRGYRAELSTSLEALVVKRWALRLSWELRYDETPPEGKVSTDTVTKASVVWRF